MKTKLLYLLIFIVITSCSNGELTRSNAKSQIIKAFNYPQDEQMKVYAEFYNSSGNYTKRALAGFENYKNHQLLTYDYINNNRTIKTSFTKKGQKYVVSGILPGGKTKFVMVKKASLDFYEITGIQVFKEFNAAEVNYKVKRTNISPFGKADGVQEEEFNKKVSFIKYDDGWRIEK